MSRVYTRLLRAKRTPFSTVRQLQALEVRYILKVPAATHVLEALGAWSRSRRADGIFEEADVIFTNSGRLLGDRLLALKGTRTVNPAEEGGLDLETPEVVQSAHLLTNIPGIHALTAWRSYKPGSCRRAADQGAEAALRRPDRRG